MLKSLNFKYFVRQLKRYMDEKELLKIYYKTPSTSTFCYIGFIARIDGNNIILKSVEFDYVKDEVQEWKLTDREIPIQHILIGAMEDAEKEVIGEWIEKESGIKLH